MKRCILMLLITCAIALNTAGQATGSPVRMGRLFVGGGSKIARVYVDDRYKGRLGAGVIEGVSQGLLKLKLEGVEGSFEAELDIRLDANNAAYCDARLVPYGSAEVKAPPEATIRVAHRNDNEGKVIEVKGGEVLERLREGVYEVTAFGPGLERREGTLSIERGKRVTWDPYFAERPIAKTAEIDSAEDKSAEAARSEPFALGSLSIPALPGASPWIGGTELVIGSMRIGLDGREHLLDLAPGRYVLATEGFLTASFELTITEGRQIDLPGLSEAFLAALSASKEAEEARLSEIAISGQRATAWTLFGLGILSAAGAGLSALAGINAANEYYVTTDSAVAESLWGAMQGTTWLTLGFGAAAVVLVPASVVVGLSPPPPLRSEALEWLESEMRKIKTEATR